MVSSRSGGRGCDYGHHPEGSSPRNDPEHQTPLQHLKLGAHTRREVERSSPDRLIEICDMKLDEHQYIRHPVGEAWSPAMRQRLDGAADLCPLPTPRVDC